MGIEVIVLHEQANRGQTLIEKFERHSARAAFAIILLTADDEGRLRAEDGELLPRGRQNVILELGFFFGKLGRDRVCTLLAEGVEKPSDIDGIVYTPFSTGGSWKVDVIREMQAAGFTLDLSNLG